MIKVLKGNKQKILDKKYEYNVPPKHNSNCYYIYLLKLYFYIINYIFIFFI